MTRHTVLERLRGFTKAYVGSCIRHKQDCEDMTQDLQGKYLELADRLLPTMPDEEFVFFAKRAAKNQILNFIRNRKASISSST